MKRIAAMLSAGAVVLGALGEPNYANAQMSADQTREENAYAVGLQAYLWGFPLHSYSRSLPKSVEVGGVYVNDFRKFAQLKTAKDKFVVTPNNATIDAYATFDLTAEPVVILYRP